ncbi:unnamed protein product [[Candida] boidinii]|nr:unnamed protein product [[Candida] boidinii]
METKESKETIEEEEAGSLDLYPLPLPDKIPHRRDIKASTCDPTSLISFLRKNIGKDITSIAMPVTSNEPVTFLQKYSESFEYFDLLNRALESDVKSGERILKIAVFAVTALSSYRAKINH